MDVLGRASFGARIPSASYLILTIIQVCFNSKSQLYEFIERARPKNASISRT